MKHLLIALLIFFSAACQKDERNYSISVPEQDKMVVYNGQAARIVFTTDPSGLALTPGNLRLVQTMSSVTASSGETPEGDVYRLSDVEPLRGDDGQAVPGKWIAVIEPAAGQTGIGITRLCLRIFQQGIAIGMSPEIEVVNVPALSDESIVIDVPTAVTYKIVPIGSSQIEPYVNSAHAFIPTTEMMLEARAMGVEWIGGVTVEVVPGGYSDFVEVTVPDADLPQEFGSFIKPVESRFSALSPGDFPVTVDVAFTVTDLGGKTFTKTVPISFYDYMVTIPASETGLDLEVGQQSEYHVKMEYALARIGITESYFAAHPYASNPALSFYTEDSAGEDALGIGVEEYWGSEAGYKNVRDPANFHVTVTHFLYPGDVATYYGNIGVSMVDYRTMRPVIAARIRLEIIAN